MREYEKETALTRVKRRGAWQAYQDTSSNNETVNQFTLFIIGATAFFAGFWALACLANTFFQDGPLSMIRQLAAAIIGR